jgi:uncharacterized protein
MPSGPEAAEPDESARKLEMLIFFLIALSILGLTNLCILRRGGQALAAYPGLRWCFYAVFGLLIAAYPLGRILGRGDGTALTRAMSQAGAIYLALMIHLFFLLILVDLLRLADKVFRFFPAGIAAHPEKTGIIAFVSILGIGIGVIIGGYVNALHPRLREIEIRIDKPAGNGADRLNIVVASDIHLGTIMGSRRLESIVRRINTLDPDIILLPGDTVDESVSRAEEEKMTACLRSLRAPFGVFSVPGNHEYYGGIAKNVGYMERGGVRVLQDGAVTVGGSFVLAGRKDPTAGRFGDPRKAIGEILKEAGIDRTLPLILLDHQPVKLGEAEAAEVDLQISGHTHAGQLFPLNIINKMIWEQYWGYLKKGKTQYYVSCGVGTWGPPVRTGSVPEIVRIRIVFTPAGSKPESE